MGEEIITDPVLKAFRKLDEDMTNRVATSDMRSLFDALGEDELQVKTHTFYSEVSDTEVGWLSRQVQLIGMEDSGQITFDDFKAFIEMKDVEEVAGKQPKNLVGC